MEYLLPYLCMVTVPHVMVGLERMLDYRGVGLERFHCTCIICIRALYVFSSKFIGDTLRGILSILFQVLLPQIEQLMQFGERTDSL